MNLSELLSKGLVEPFQSNPEDVKNEIDIAKNDLSSAKKMMAINEWAGLTMRPIMQCCKQEEH
ncbi:MAG: hypothetical protein ACREA3_07070 [Nitrosotalea sp.]